MWLLLFINITMGDFSASAKDLYNQGFGDRLKRIRRKRKKSA